MIHKITTTQKHGNSHIQILYPGHAIGANDIGIGSIGRIDHANIHNSTTIKMHPHANDEILSYFRTGRVIHSDSSGQDMEITRKKLMLMKAGKVFYHEEKIIDGLEGLQIFIRPMVSDYEPSVIFHDLSEADSINNWRHLASFENTSPLQFTSQTDIFDISINDPQLLDLPVSTLSNQVSILYNFNGNSIVNDTIVLGKGECVIFENEIVTVSTNDSAELVLFVTDKNQNCFKKGMFSGNQF